MCMTFKIKRLPILNWNIFKILLYFNRWWRNNLRWKLTKLTPLMRGSWERCCSEICQPTWWQGCAWQLRILWKHSFPNSKRKCTACIPGTMSKKSTIWHIWHIWLTGRPYSQSSRHAICCLYLLSLFANNSGEFWSIRIWEFLPRSLPEEATKKDWDEGGEPLSIKWILTNKSQIKNADNWICVGDAEFVFSKK